MWRDLLRFPRLSVARLIVCVFLLVAVIFDGRRHVVDAVSVVVVPAVYKEWRFPGYEPEWYTNMTMQKEFNYSVFMYQKHDPEKPNFIRNRGTEGGVYLRYIVDHYYDYPDVGIFIHHYPEQHAPQWLEALKCLSPGAEEVWYNFNQQGWGGRKPNNWESIAGWMEQCWRDTFQILWGLQNNITEFERRMPPETDLIAYPIWANQFILGRKQMLSKPLSVYKELLKIFNEQDVCHIGDLDNSKLVNKNNNGSEPPDLTAEIGWSFNKRDHEAPGKGFGRHIQGGTIEHLSQAIFGSFGLDVTPPDKKLKCETFIHNCPWIEPHSPYYCDTP